MFSFALWLFRVLMELTIMIMSAFIKLIVWFVSCLTSHTGEEEEDSEFC